MAFVLSPNELVVVQYGSDYDVGRVKGLRRHSLLLIETLGSGSEATTMECSLDCVIDGGEEEEGDEGEEQGQGQEQQPEEEDDVEMDGVKEGAMDEEEEDESVFAAWAQRLISPPPDPAPATSTGSPVLTAFATNENDIAKTVSHLERIAPDTRRCIAFQLRSLAPLPVPSEEYLTSLRVLLHYLACRNPAQAARYASYLRAECVRHEVAPHSVLERL